MTVFYFTATGNSLYVAKQFSDAPISIPQALKRETLSYKDDVIGIVSPTYYGEFPQIVRRFIEKASIEAEYVFLLQTYGMDVTMACEVDTAFCAEHGLTVDYAQPILMVDNFLGGFDMAAEMAMDKPTAANIAKCKEDIANRVKDIHICTNPQSKGLYEMVSKQRKSMPPVQGSMMFKLGEACNGCGICTKVCPLGSLEVKDGKMSRVNEACEVCLACIQNCPQKAITMAFPERNPNARYRHPEITLDEIIQANKQG